LIFLDAIPANAGLAARFRRYFSQNPGVDFQIRAPAFISSGLSDIMPAAVRLAADRANIFI